MRGAFYSMGKKEFTSKLVEIAFRQDKKTNNNIF
jgi:hypothetical protein